MTVALFDTIGKTYDETRRVDGRIVARIRALLSLPTGSQIADIGAGTGNYSIALAEAGFQIYAIEPSTVMQCQARSHPNIEWLYGTAEHIPLENASVDGIVSTLAVCHFSDIRKAITEMARISRGNSIVIFTFDCDAGKRTWLYEYFPFFWDPFDALPSVRQIADMLGRATGCSTEIEPFPLSPDITDGFAAAAWRHPRRYLDEDYRANISSFRKAEPEVVARSVRKLSDDLASGSWDERYGSLMRLPVLDAGYRFIFTTAKNI